MVLPCSAHHVLINLSFCLHHNTMTLYRDTHCENTQLPSNTCHHGLSNPTKHLAIMLPAKFTINYCEAFPSCHVWDWWHYAWPITCTLVVLLCSPSECGIKHFSVGCSYARHANAAAWSPVNDSSISMCIVQVLVWENHDAHMSSISSCSVVWMCMMYFDRLGVMWTCIVLCVSEDLRIRVSVCCSLVWRAKQRITTNCIVPPNHNVFDCSL